MRRGTDVCAARPRRLIPRLGAPLRAINVENVFKPIGQGGTTATVRFEGIKITGGNFKGTSAPGPP